MYLPVLRSELAGFALKKLIREAKIPTHATFSVVGFRVSCSFGCHVLLYALFVIEREREGEKILIIEE